MKNILLSWICLMIYCLQVQTTFANNEKEVLTKAVIKTTFYCDHCLECESCAGRFETQLKHIKGLKKYTIFDKKNAIVVYYNNKQTTIQDIRLEISKMGFDADNIKANSKAYNKLDACCKKK